MSEVHRGSLEWLNARVAELESENSAIKRRQDELVAEKVGLVSASSYHFSIVATVSLVLESCWPNTRVDPGDIDNPSTQVVELVKKLADEVSEVREAFARRPALADCTSLRQMADRACALAGQHDELNRRCGEYRARAEKAEAVIAQHDLCHDQHGKVDARAFADGCAAEQRKLYGQAPDADRLSFEALREANASRALRWHPQGIEEWSLNDWLCAMAGEAGEACNAGKKHRRILSGLRQSGNVPSDLLDAEDRIMDELADTVIYSDLCAARMGRSLADWIIRKFNAISDREGFPERLGVQS
jgi:NTP pyrophosphatase (non-canonical NTP hydrolase)